MDKTNTFQIVIRALEGEGDFILEYRYRQLEWTSGDQSGGHDGLGGEIPFSGVIINGVIHVELPFSRQADILKSAIENEGIWKIRVVDGIYQLINSQSPVASGTVSMNTTPTAAVLPFTTFSSFLRETMIPPTDHMPSGSMSFNSLELKIAAMLLPLLVIINSQ